MFNRGAGGRKKHVNLHIHLHKNFRSGGCRVYTLQGAWQCNGWHIITLQRDGDTLCLKPFHTFSRALINLSTWNPLNPLLVFLVVIKSRHQIINKTMVSIIRYPGFINVYKSRILLTHLCSCRPPSNLIGLWLNVDAPLSPLLLADHLWNVVTPWCLSVP